MSRLSCLFLSLLAATVLPHVAAHGFVRSVSIDGTIYEGSLPGKNQGASPIRTIASIDPVKGTSNPDLFCGASAQFAAVDAPAAPGSNVTFQWVGGATGDGKWPHAVGPLMTYMASCGGSCTNFNNSKAAWFKIAQAGQKPGGNAWYQADIMNGDGYSIVLPNNLAPGGYLIRHEIISLQLALTEGGVEFYPMCAQLSVSGSGNGQPSPTVTFPGAYSDTDAGILTPNVYNPGFNYVFPGGAIANLAAPESGSVPAINVNAPFVSGSLAVSAPAQTGSATGAPSASASASIPVSSGSAVPPASASAPDLAPSVSAPAPSASASSPSCHLHPSPVANSTTAGVSKRNHGRMMRRLRHSS